MLFSANSTDNFNSAWITSKNGKTNPNQRMEKQILSLENRN